MSFYDWLAQRSWRLGRFAAADRARAGASAGAWKSPEILRDDIRCDMERIVSEEAELAPPLKEAGMKLAKFVKFREEKFGGVLFETRQEKVYTLNPTAAAVVKEIVAGTDDIAGKLKTRYDCGCKSDCIEPEVRALVADLKQKGLLTE